MATALVTAWTCVLLPLPAVAQDHSRHLLSSPAAAGTRVTTVDDEVSIPDVRVVDQDGRERRFYSDLVAGRTVAMNFIFTTCTTICLPLGAVFMKLQGLLEETGRDVDLISVSVDPVTDTPARMRAWGQRFGAEDRWTLVTGNKTEIDRLLQSLEAYTPDPEQHSALILVGDETSRRWKRLSGLATPAEIVALIDEVRGVEGIDEQ